MEPPLSAGSKVDDRDVQPPRRQPAQEALICGDEGRVLALGEGEVHAVVYRVAQASCHIHRARYQWPSRAEVDSASSHEIERRVGLTGRDLFGRGLPPERVRNFDEQKIGSEDVVLTVTDTVRLVAQDLRDDPLDRDAGINHPAHRSRSFRTSLVLSLCRRSTSFRRNAYARSPKPVRAARAASVRIVRSSRSSETPFRAARDFKRRIA